MGKRVNKHISEEDTEIAISTKRCPTCLFIREKIRTTIKFHYTLN